MTKQKFKELFLKCLPMLIVLVSTGIFIFAIKFVIGLFYAPKDTVYVKDNGAEKFTVIQCYQNPSSHYYLLPGDFQYDETKYKDVASEHDKIHMRDEPLAIFTLNETPLDIENSTIKTLFTGNGVNAYQFGEFIIYKLEGQYGIIPYFVGSAAYPADFFDDFKAVYIARAILSAAHEQQISDMGKAKVQE